MNPDQPAQPQDEPADLAARLQRIETTLAEVHRSVERTRRYFLWTFIISVGAVLLPLIGIGILLPQVISTFSGGGF